MSPAIAADVGELGEGGAEVGQNVAEEDVAVGKDVAVETAEADVAVGVVKCPEQDVAVGVVKCAEQDVAVGVVKCPVTQQKKVTTVKKVKKAADGSMTQQKMAREVMRQKIAKLAKKTQSWQRGWQRRGLFPV